MLLRMKPGTLFLSCYMIVVSLAPNFGGSELLKLPALITHYIQHFEQNRGLSIAEFMDMHYMQNNDPDSDYQQDMQLPFKSMNAMLHSHIVVAPLALPEFNFKPVAIKVEKLHTPASLPLLFQSLSNIWQPPKA